MKIDLDGSFDTPATPEAVFAFLTNPQRFAPILPFFQTLTQNPDGTFVVVLEVGVPQIRGQAEVTVTPVESVPNRNVVYKASGRHALGMMDLALRFGIDAPAAGSMVTWATTCVVNGTLASLARGILLPIAKRQIEALAKAAQAALDPVPPAAAPPAAREKASSLRGLFARKGASA